MNRFINTTSTLALGVMLMLATPAMAEGMANQARAAIAEATGKIDAAIKVGTDGRALSIQSEAQDALALARKELDGGEKAKAIIDAQHASKLADAAIAEVSRTRAATASTQRAQSDAMASVAMQSAANANARADAAQQSAAVSNAQADAANERANRTPVVFVSPPAPTQATVTTETTETSSVAATPAASAPNKHRAAKHRHALRKWHKTTKRTTTTTQAN